MDRFNNYNRKFNKDYARFSWCIESANAIMKGLEINYNFNRKHMSLGKKASAEIAILQLELGVKKWLCLIKLSKI